MLNEVEFGIIPDEFDEYDGKQKLFVDFDGVVVNTVKAVCEVYNTWWSNKTEYKYANYKMAWKWDMTDIIPYLNPRQIDSIFEYEKFFNALEFMDGAYEVLEMLNEKYDITIVTMGSLTNLSMKAEWIKTNLPFIHKVVLLHNAYDDADKSIIDMRDGILLDDNQNNLWTSDALETYVFGEIYEYNQDFKGTRLYTWDDVRRKLL